MNLLDIIVEVGSIENARAISKLLCRVGVPVFAQKFGWRRVKEFGDIPTSYKEGRLFFSKQPSMPWPLDSLVKWTSASTELE